MFEFIRKKVREVVRANSRNDIELNEWFYYWLFQQNYSYRREFSPSNCYYEFGTGGGYSMSEFAKAAVRFCKETSLDIEEIKIFGFDSFQGLPSKQFKADDNPQWDKGEFAFDKAHIIKVIERTGFPTDNVTLIEGFYEDSLNDKTLSDVKDHPPSIVTLDVDYYSSTKLALEFMAPILQSGTVFYFDDLYSFHLNPNMGQLKAINEFNGRLGHLSPLREYDYKGKTFMFAKLEWEHSSDS